MARKFKLQSSLIVLLCKELGLFYKCALESGSWILNFQSYLSFFLPLCFKLHGSLFFKRMKSWYKKLAPQTCHQMGWGEDWKNRHWTNWRFSYPSKIALLKKKQRLQTNISQILKESRAYCSEFLEPQLKVPFITLSSIILTSFERLETFFYRPLSFNDFVFGKIKGFWPWKNGA